MKKYIFFTLILFISQYIFAKSSVGYNDFFSKSLAEGYAVRYSIASDVEQDSLVVLMKSYSFGITENPKIKFEFFDGDTLLLSGVRKKRSHIYTEEEIDVVESAMIGGALFGAIGGAIGEGMKRDSINDKFSYSIAAFPITHEQIEMFQLGVRAISVTSAPIMHKRQFKKDKIGKRLYKIYIKKQSNKQM